MTDYSNYQSPYSWRYASPEMRAIWSEENKRKIWRRIWVALAEVQQEYGLVKPEQTADLRAAMERIDIERALAIEAEIHHDLMAELTTFAEQAPIGGGALHMGATSMDIEDNCDALRVQQSLRLILNQYKNLLAALAVRIEATAHTPTLAFTHIQPAEPTTIGYRLALYAQDLLNVYLQLSTLLAQLRGKGFKGAVGVGAAYGDLFGAENLDAFEAKMSARLDLPFFTIASQTYPRLQDYQIISALSGMGAVLHKFAFDLRLLQSPVFGEWSEPFGKKQVGSSAMPFKRNPINAEKIDSLARSLSVLPQVAWSNAATSLLERTLDDSANRRSDLPEAFLISDELLKVSTRLIQGFVINEAAVERNLLNFAPFSAIERILMALSAKGASRQAMHERLRQHALDAWQVVQQGQANDLLARVAADDEIRRYLSAEEISELAQVQGYIGFAPQHALKMAAEIEQQIR